MKISLLVVPVTFAAVLLGLSGCGQKTTMPNPSVAVAPSVGKVSGSPIPNGAGPFGGQTVIWYVMELIHHTPPYAPDDPTAQELSWCLGQNSKPNAAAGVLEIQRRQATLSCRNANFAVGQAKGPYPGEDEAWFRSHPTELAKEVAWCQGMGTPVHGQACINAISVAHGS